MSGRVAMSMTMEVRFVFRILERCGLAAVRSPRFLDLDEGGLDRWAARSFDLPQAANRREGCCLRHQPTCKASIRRTTHGTFQPH